VFPRTYGGRPAGLREKRRLARLSVSGPGAVRSTPHSHGPMVLRVSSRAVKSNNGRIHASRNQQGRAARPWTRLIAEVPRSATALYTRQRIHKEHRARHTTGSAQHREIRGGVRTARQVGNRVIESGPKVERFEAGALQTHTHAHTHTQSHWQSGFPTASATVLSGCSASDVSRGCHCQWTGLS
jgi:hypothetical protein